jgi:hypothetical protein
LRPWAWSGSAWRGSETFAFTICPPQGVRLPGEDGIDVVSVLRSARDIDSNLGVDE